MGRALGPSLLLTHLCLCWQPERINPELNQKGYSVKSDIWSLGITMVPSPGGSRVARGDCGFTALPTVMLVERAELRNAARGWREGGWSCWDVQQQLPGDGSMG